MALTLRTNDELEQALDALVAREGTSLQEVISRAILERYQNLEHLDVVERSADRMIDRWGDVLHRLDTE